jgi:hypothetical protein
MQPRQSTWIYCNVYYPQILRVQNKIRIHFRIEMCMAVVKSHSTQLTIVTYLLYVLIYDEVGAKFSIKLKIKN